MAFADRPLERSDVRSALCYLDPSVARAEWVTIGMAIKSEFPDGFDLFDEWSSGGASYKPADCRATWRSIKAGGGIGIGTLFKLAQQAGWEFERRELSTEEKNRLERERAQRLAERKLRDEKEQAIKAALRQRTAKVAQQIFAHEVKPVGESKYLAAKGVRAHGLGFPRRQLLVISDESTGNISVLTDPERIRSVLPRLKDKPDTVSTRYIKKGVVLVPLQDEQGTLVNIQFLWGSGKKSFFLGGRKMGCFHFIDEQQLYLATRSPAPPICVGEGYATMATVHEATGWPCVVAFDEGNLLGVCKAIRARYPSHKIIVAGDDDRQTEGNPGRTSALAAASAVAGPKGDMAWAVFPDFNLIKEAS
ncbi:PriCT-2 domain-containing protein [uncultured Zhongshania sp.]|uniref:PriCT-2 domain-containing protein n=1 Tax=uncultured Zhongshania sp. TaxID=1642288 RepID=UPI0030DA5E7B